MSDDALHELPDGARDKASAPTAVVAEDEEPDAGEGTAVPLASVVLWLPPARKKARWGQWAAWVLVAGCVPLMVAGMEPWMRIVAAVIAVWSAGAATVAAVNRRRRVAQCRPSHLTVGEGYLELREGAGAASRTRRWPLADVRSIRFKGARFASGGDVIIAAAEGPVTVMTGPPAQRTKDALKHVRAAARVQGFELGTGRRARFESAGTSPGAGAAG